MKPATEGAEDGKRFAFLTMAQKRGTSACDLEKNLVAVEVVVGVKLPIEVKITVKTITITTAEPMICMIRALSGFLKMAFSL